MSKIQKATIEFLRFLNEEMYNPQNEDHILNQRPYVFSYRLQDRKGSKNYKIIQIQGHSDNEGQSAYCWVNKENGEIYKTSGWSAPAKGSRGNVLNPKDYKIADYIGSWLYRN